MSSDPSRDCSIRLGDRVRVKPGRTDIAYDEILLEGWTGTVCEVNGDMCCVRWSDETLERMPEKYRQRWQGEGLPVDSLWLQKDSVESYCDGAESF